ncbi:type II toxin-antitoxin system HicA family toxin [Pseudaminobacter sp. 19-2017]|uniref:Type II toxin-antitoxin system HicA family toxin n=1 Tax=Pseudaminobacter soli (ex Zhang et al. 2022) TaxID=2831468 RepID=A0A942I415_9HYPH|nr:type II toxin-antitoxin system HicA family toxin [Pseudaminobacter soli]MBS3650749.1 type II toxin-antitoxin system HicA family toxin [Pseudaminobacter soli]
MALNARHRKTLNAIFADPVSGAIKWRDIEAMLLALDGKISQGSGSRVKVVLGTAVAVFHRPHPSPDTDKGVVKAVRRFLTSAGVKP